jgi:hypothetical protein
MCVAYATSPHFMQPDPAEGCVQSGSNSTDNRLLLGVLAKSVIKLRAVDFQLHILVGAGAMLWTLLGLSGRAI